MGHELDLSSLHDVIGHVTIWYPVHGPYSHSYWWSFWNQASI